MRGIVLAGGRGSRLGKLTKVINKNILPVGSIPMILHPIQKLLDANIKDIMIICGPEHMGALIELLGSGAEYGCTFTYRVQDEPIGIAHGLGLTQDFVGSDTCALILGDNIYEDNLSNEVIHFTNNKKTHFHCKVFLKEVSDANRFCVATVKDSKIIKLVEKPAEPETNFAVTGFYLFDNHVFSIIDTLTPSARGEYEITDVLNEYLRCGTVEYSVLEGFWRDAGTIDALVEVNNLVMNMRSRCQ